MRELTFTHTIGAGAFGTVYKAELSTEQDFRRQVAVKIISGDHAEKEMFLTRMRDEARLLGLLQGDHILRVLDLLSLNDRDAIIMEYIDGVDLAHAIDAGQPPPLRAAMEIGAIVADTLDRAHSAVHPKSGEPLGVVHRDVKPANVMLTASGNLKLLDFGVAQAKFAARESQTGQMVLGTLNYMAPDYIISGEVTPAIDVYGLGLTLFELCTGEVFGQPTLREDRHNLRLAERLERIGPNHPQLSALLSRMLHWSPEERPSCTECAQALLQLSDASHGAGLRRYASSVIPTLLHARAPQPDREGLLGTTVQIGINNLVSMLAPQSASPPTGEPEVPIEQTGTNETDEAATTISSRGAIEDRVKPAKSLESRAAHPATPDNTQASGPHTSPPRLTASRAALRGVMFGGLVGLLAVGVLAVVLFYIFPPTNLP